MSRKCVKTLTASILGLFMLAKSEHLEPAKTTKGYNYLLGTGYLVEISSFHNTRDFSQNT